MRTVPLHGKYGEGRVALVDDEDYDLVSRYRWLVKPGHNDVCYAYTHQRTEGDWRRTFMHALLTGWSPADHINHDGLDNQRSNLRDGSGGGNSYNKRKPKSGTTSQYKGVHWYPTKRRWAAEIRARGVKYRLGRFRSEEDAAKAYDAAATRLFGEFAILNFPAELPEAVKCTRLPASGQCWAVSR